MENLMIYKNESGIFTCDAEGRLLKYECSPENRLELSDCRDKFSIFGEDWMEPEDNRKGKTIKRLVIPSGVRQIGSCSIHFEEGGISFEKYVVRDEIVFPETLKIIGNNIFQNTMLPEVRFTSALNCIGSYSFFCAMIRKLVLSSDIKPVYRYFYSDSVYPYFIGDPTQGCIEITKEELLETHLCLGGRQFKNACIDTLVLPNKCEDAVLLLTESYIRKAIRYQEYDISVLPENTNPRLACFMHLDNYMYLDDVLGNLE